MKAVIQRVGFSNVKVDGETIGEIENGFMILLGVMEGDTESDADLIAKKTAAMRIFEDENGKMNLSLQDTNGSCLVISQFTLAADCKKGNRPSFINAAKPDEANRLYEYFMQKLKENGVNKVESGSFGADMKVTLLNDGPVTIILDSEAIKPKG